MPTVYDDQETKTAADIAREDQERMGAGRTAAQDNEIDRLNEQFYKSDDSGSDKKGSRFGRLKSFGKKHKKKIWLGGAGLGGGFLGLMMIMFILGSLLLPHFFENILAMRFANSARAYRLMNSQIVSKKVVLDTADETKYQAAKRRYGELRSWVAMEKYRPAAIVRNMEAQSKLDFEYTPRKNPLARPRLTAIKVNGVRIPIEQQSKWGIPFSRAGNNIRLAQSIDEALYKTMRGRHVAMQVLRTGVGAEIMDRIGYRKVYAWANKAQEYRGTSNKQADVKLLRESSARAIGEGVKGTPALPANEEAARETKAVLVSELADDTAAAEIAETGEPTNKIIETMNRTLQDTKLETVVKFGSTTSAAAMAACLIFDGSTESSGPLIDAKAEAAQRQFLYLGSASHQQQAGDGVGEAIGAFNRKLNDEGGLARANAQALAEGATPDTNAIISPYANGASDFTLANVVFGEFGNTLNTGLIPTCKVVASVGFGVVAGIAELTIGFFTGGSSAAAGRAGTVALNRVVTQYLKDFAASLVSKQNIRRTVVQGGALASATLLAKMIVSQYADMYFNNTAKNEVLANEIEAGAEANANEVSQALGGWTMTSEESIVTRVKSREANAVEQQTLGPFERYFALTNPQSLLTRAGYTVMGNANTSFIGRGLSTISQIFNPMAIMGLFSNLSPRVSAAQALDEASYTRTVWGWTEPELKLIAEKETYFDVFENERILNESGKREAIEEKYGKCTGPNKKTVGELISEKHIVREKHGTPDPDQGDCAPNKKSIKNPEFGDLVFRWRISILSDAVLKMGDELANPTPNNTAETAAASGGALIWPMPKSQQLSDCYGSETKHHRYPHAGIDMWGPNGSEIVAASDGRVTFAGPNGDYGGNFVVIKHANGISTSYAHMRARSVELGETVKAGQKIGVQGTQGKSTGDHLHFNVFPGNYKGDDKANVNPLKYVSIPSSTKNPDNCSANASKNF